MNIAQTSEGFSPQEENPSRGGSSVITRWHANKKPKFNSSRDHFIVLNNKIFKVFHNHGGILLDVEIGNSEYE